MEKEAGGVPSTRRIRGGHVLAGLVLLVLTLWYVFCAQLAALPPEVRPYAADFNTFYAAARLAHENGLADAYRIGALDAADFMGPDTPSRTVLYTYPPQFAFVLWPFATLERGVAFALFVGLSLAFYLIVLLRVAGRHAGMVLLTGLPVLMISVENGQSSLLVGGLAGLYVLMALDRGAGAGLPLGLMVIKPHLGLGFGLNALAEARLGLLAVAFSVAILSGVLATLVFGTGIWAPFLESGSAAADKLAVKEFKLDRMTSVYALAVTAGATHGLAMAAHLVGAALAALAIVWTARRALGLRTRLGIAALLTLAFSPYVYDYDQSIMLIALALLWEDLIRRSRLWERLLFPCLGWLMAYGVYFRGLVEGIRPQIDPLATDDPFSVEALAYLGLVVLTALILRRQPRIA